MRSLPTVDALVVDLSVIVRAQAAIIPFGSTFDEFSGSILRNITGAATYHGADRVDIVSDQYSDKSIRYHTRLDIQSNIEFDRNTVVPENIATTFLTDETNKIKLDDLIAQKCRNLSTLNWNEQFCVTNRLTDMITDNGEKVMYTPNMISVLEEANNRIVCHINDLLENGFSKISVKTCDTDVIVILLGFMEQFLDAMPELELFVDFNTSENKKYVYQLLLPLTR